MKSLSQIILEECVPQRDGMLTLQDPAGETGFFYFKDGELIEANYAAHWGRDAVDQVLNWQIAEYTIAPLPLGIKRSVWEPVEVLLRLTAAEHAAQPVFKVEKLPEEPTPYDQLKTLEGVTKIFLINADGEKAIHEAEDVPPQATGWMVEFYQRARSVGDTLGFGKLRRWTVLTDRYQAVALQQGENFVGVLREHNTGGDDFEAACKDSFSNLPKP